MNELYCSLCDYLGFDTARGASGKDKPTMRPLVFYNSEKARICYFGNKAVPCSSAYLKETPNVFLSLIAHELGHTTRHIIGSEIYKLGVKDVEEKVRLFLNDSRSLTSIEPSFETQRKIEYAADKVAVKLGFGDGLVEYFGNNLPGIPTGALTDTHPTHSERIQRAKEIQRSLPPIIRR